MKKREFELILNKLLEKELESLRKKFRPYKRKPFLRNKTTIEVDLKYNKENTLGYYENTKGKENQWKYTHKIFITKLQKESYETYVKWHWKRAALKNLRDVIRHELIHAFVFEEFEEWDEIKNSHGDYSPVFLSCLYWAGGSSGHKYVNEFKKTNLYEAIKECSSYEEVYINIITYIRELEKTVKKINNVINLDDKEYRNLKIEFNNYGPGIVKKKYISAILRQKKDNKFYRKKVTEMTLGLGFLVTPQDILNNYERKFDNESIAEFHSEIAAYNIKNELKQNSIIRESKVC